MVHTSFRSRGDNFTRVRNNNNFRMLALRLPPEIERRLDSLARKMRRSKSQLARETILRHFDDIEDVYLARRRLARDETRIPLESLERQLKKRSKRL